MDRLCRIVEDFLHLTRPASERPEHEVEPDVPGELPLTAVDDVLLELL